MKRNELILTTQGPFDSLVFYLVTSHTRELSLYYVWYMVDGEVGVAEVFCQYILSK